MKQFFIDIETNQSLDPKTGEITQLAGIIKHNGIQIETINFKSNIYNNLISTLDKHINRFDPKDKFHFIAYNAKFDSEFIRELFNKNKNKFYGSYFYQVPVDVLNLVAYKFMLRKKDIENMKLSTVARELGLKVDEKRLHDALYDVTLTNRLYKILIKL